MSSSIRAVLAVATVVAAVAFSGGEAAAQKAKAACGVRMFPLAVGNKWSFVPGTPPQQPPEAMVRFIPLQPKLVVVTVTAIDVKDGKSVVSLDEDIDGRKLKTSITCGGGTFEASPDSFFFAGEPGGALNLELDKVERKVLEGAPWAGTTWREDLVAQWKRVPEAGMQIDLGAGKLEIERRFTISRAETLTPPFKAQGVSAQRLTVEVTGRVTTTGIDKPSEMPANWINAMWFADGLGPVQVLNSYYHLYQLTDAVLAK